MSSTDKTVLHIIESYGGGSARAAETYALATPQYRHVVLRRPRAGEYIAGQEYRAFAEVHDLPAGTFGAIRAIRRVTRMLLPVRVHAHSSWAGALARVALPFRVARRRLVYTPHCFAFERLDLPAPARAAFAAVELLLSVKTDLIAACSERERRTAARMWARRPPVVVPNIASVPESTPAATRDSRLVGIGRVGAQKDPFLFARIAHDARARGVADDAVWLGGGDRDVERELTDTGLSVSGWLDTAEVAEACRRASVYVHTARWEGFPLSILEAHRCGLPIIARRIPALVDAPTEWLFSTASEAVDLVAALRSSEATAENRAAWARILSGNTIESQRAALSAVYRPAGP